MILHQLMLNEVLFFVQDEIQDARFILPDPETHFYGDLQPGRRKEITPDLSVEHKDFVLAVELERTQKNLLEYTGRMEFYRESIYTHVLYVYASDNQRASLVKAAGRSRKFAFAHFNNPNRLATESWGPISLNDWIKKVISISAVNAHTPKLLFS